MIGKDMELVVRLHLRLADTPYRITFVLDSVCWTEAPEDLRTLKNQRIRWQRRLCESLTKNVDLIFHAKGGRIGWVAFPFMAVFVWIGPAIEVLGYCFLALSFVMGFVSIQAWLILLVAAIGLGVLRDMWKLVLAAILENFGVRQLNTLWKLIGLYRWVCGKKSTWGAMTRTASWQAR